MKKLLTSALLVFAFLTVNAGTNQPDNSVNAKATEIARQMVNQAQLNESEYIKVRQLTIQKLERENEIRSMYSNDPDMLNRKIAEAQNSFNYQLQSSLNTKQYAAYIAITNGVNNNIGVVAENKEKE